MTTTAAAKTSDKATATKKAAPKAVEEPKGQQSIGQEAPKEAAKQDDGRNRVNYKPDTDKGHLEVSYGAEVLTLSADTDVLEDDAVKDHLAYLGLITYLQRESSRARNEDKLDAIDEAYASLVSQGMQAFERKSNAPKGPKKADKIAALAMLKGRTPDAVRDAVKKLPQAEQDKLLNHPKVLAKVEELRSGDADDLSV